MASPSPWPGKIGRTWNESTPWMDPLRRPREGAPNVLLVVLDDAGFGHLGCYGSTIATPNIDALAAEGRRYTNFHTTAMCSPTRASLLTGRNHHAVGMGIIADMCTGYPGYQGEIVRNAATLPEMLVPAGYSAFALGKWHLTRARHMSAAGPFDQWPLGRGFQRYYGFLYSLIDQWHPELVSDNHFISLPQTPGYHLSEDLVDQTIHMIRDQKYADPERPFFAYLAFGACHSPHQAPKSYIDAYRGAFDEGWDVMRERWHRRQLDMGVIPPETRLTPRNRFVTAWDAMSEDERRVCARHQEVFAGFLTHTDAQIGRLTAWLAARDMLDDTLVILLSDNGASAEGGAYGHLNLRRQTQLHKDTLAEHLAAIDELGSDLHWNNFPAGWGHAGNTPHKWFKMQTHNGGVRDPLIVRWPERIREGGTISTQFCHCSDLAPTILEVAGVEPPKVLDGVYQLPVTGTSIAYTFDEPDAPSRKHVQYFELMGNRAIWADGWKAVARHFEGDDYEQDRWELYHLDSDFSEAEDLAEREPEKLAELIALWEREARANHVFPLDDRDLSRLGHTYYLKPRDHWDYEQGQARASGYVAPMVANRSYRIAADVTLDQRSAGVIFAVGGKAGGYALFVDKGRLVHQYVGPGHTEVLESTDPLPAGRHELVFDFRKTGDCRGTARLLCDGVEIGRQELDDMWPWSANGGGATCGYDDASPVSDRYDMPGTFTGTIHGVSVDAGEDYRIDRELEVHVALNED